MSTEGLIKHSQSYFRVVFANTSELVEQVYRVRAAVYCEEFSYEECPEGFEQDAYDWQSFHCLLIHCASNVSAGCVRLVEVPDNAPSRPLPFEKAFKSKLYPEALHPSQLSRKTICEISRLAIPATFRKRPGEAESRYGNLDAIDLTEQNIRTFPILCIALFLAAIALVVLTKRYHVFAMMESKLARLLQRSGLKFTQVSELMEYHGLRAVFHITIEQALAGMKPELREMYDFVYQSVKADFVASGFRDDTNSV